MIYGEYVKADQFPHDLKMRKEFYKLPTGTLYIPHTTIIPNFASLYYFILTRAFKLPTTVMVESLLKASWVHIVMDF